MAGQLIDLELLTYYDNKLKTEVLAKKVDKEAGKALSTNDYTNSDKAKLDAIETGAQKNVKPDWSAAPGAVSEILNKPTSLPANGGNADTVAGFTVGVNVPANAKFTDTTYSAFVGATSTVDGKIGLVPAPKAADRDKYLKGDGTWVPIEQVTIDAAENDKLGIVQGGSAGDVDIAKGIITVKDNSHNHIIANVSGLQAALDGKAATEDIPTLATDTKNGLMSASDFTKLKGVATGANKTVVDSTLSSSSANPLSNKAIYTELQKYVPTTTTINGVPLDGGEIIITAEDLDVIPSTDVGAANGIASLDENGKVPSSQLPSFVDDVIEGYYYQNKFYTSNLHTTEIKGESGKIYIDVETSKSYRWSGTMFVEISSSLALGETSSTAFRGDHGKIAYDFAIGEHAPVGAQVNVIESVQVNGAALTITNKTVNVDLSGYALASDVTLATTGEIDALFAK